MYVDKKKQAENATSLAEYLCRQLHPSKLRQGHNRKSVTADSCILNQEEKMFSIEY
jgi:hypothetical protein